jgi:hypothetical protein
VIRFFLLSGTISFTLFIPSPKSVGERAQEGGMLRVGIAITEKLGAKPPSLGSLMGMLTERIAQVSEPVDPGGIEPSVWLKNPCDLTHGKLSISEGAEVVHGAEAEHHIDTCCLEMGQMGRRSMLAIEDLRGPPGSLQTSHSGIQQAL